MSEGQIDRVISDQCDTICSMSLRIAELEAEAERQAKLKLYSIGEFGLATTRIAELEAEVKQWREWYAAIPEYTAVEIEQFDMPPRPGATDDE